MIIYLHVKPLFPYYFLLIATMTKAMSANSQQLLVIILFLCEVITLNKINMNSLFLFILFLFSFIHPRSWQNNQALDSTLIFIIYSSRTRLHREIIKQNSKLDHAINFILLDQDTTNRIELRKTVKIGVVIVIRYRGTSPKLGSCQGECPYPCDYVSLVGEEGGGDVGLVDGLVFSLKSSISCSRLSIFLHSSFLFSCKR